MTSLEDLQNALDELRKKKLPYNDSLVSTSDIDQLCALFSAFKQDHDKLWMPKCKTDDCINWEDGDCSYGFAWRVQYCKSHYDKLLDASK